MPTTDMDDKLIQAFADAFFAHLKHGDEAHQKWLREETDKFFAEKAPAFRSAILADAAKDVEPVAFMFQHSETGRITFVDAWQKENGWAAGNPRFFEVDALVPASTLAAAQALNAELVARLEGLEKDAARYRWLRDGELTADYPYPVMRMGGSRVDDQTIWADELDAAIDDAISAAQHPQQEQP